VVRTGPVVIIHVRMMVASRARRDDVKPTANMNIQGGMTIRMTGLRSRLKERHDEKKGKEKRERARRPDVERERTAAGPLNPFSRLVESVDVCGCVRTYILNKWRILVNSHVATAVGRQRSRWQPPHNEGSVVAPAKKFNKLNKHYCHSWPPHGALAAFYIKYSVELTRCANACKLEA
jgi:hypothetical protein